MKKRFALSFGFANQDPQFGTLLRLSLQTPLLLPTDLGPYTTYRVAERPLSCRPT